MNVLIPLFVAVGLFVVIGRFYSRRLARMLGEDPNRPVPAVTKADGVDYVPTRTPIAFAQHFAAIAGAGPIVGPILALVYGWQWCWLWVVIGALFFGSVHDYLALYMSVREDGATIVGLARKYMGKTGYTIFIAFVVTMLLIVNAVFLIVSAKALVSQVPVGEMHFSEALPETMFRVQGGKAWVGGIGSSSVITITLFAPLLGWLYLKKKVSTWLCSLLAIGLCVLSVWVGILWPVPLGYETVFGLDGMSIWIGVLALYCLIAAGLPLWMLIQSRDFINVHILYGGLAILVLGLLSIGLLHQGTLKMSPTPRETLIANVDKLHADAAGADPAVAAAARKALSDYEAPAPAPKDAAAAPTTAPTTAAPAAAATPAMASLFDFGDVYWIWPGLFITIACGAVSGFHSLCASGTASRQVTSEPAARKVGVWAMLLEGLLAVLVISAVSYTFDSAHYAKLIYPNKSLGLNQNPVIVFAQAVGTVGYDGLGIPMALGIILGMLMLEGFLVTTLDTSVRLTRYLLEEMLAMVFPGRKFNPWLTTLAVVIGSVAVTVAGAGNVVHLWDVFGTGNQLLAAFGLIVASLWLLKLGKSAVYALVPACIMLTTTVTMLVLQLYRFVTRIDVMLAIAAALVLFLGVAFLITAAKTLVERLRGGAEPTPA